MDNYVYMYVFHNGEAIALQQWPGIHTLPDGAYLYFCNSDGNQWGQSNVVRGNWNYVAAGDVPQPVKAMALLLGLTP